MTFVRAGVIGHPIAHSKSPLIHNHWIGEMGLSGEYRAIDIDPRNLEEGVRELRAQGYAGFNVTIPHKQAIFALCDQVDDKARAVGAVNTVTIKQGRMYGTNTDIFGFMENLTHSVPNLLHLAQRPSVVLGAGGAARAIVYALLLAGARNIMISNRTREKAVEVAGLDSRRIDVVPWDMREEVLRGAGLLVNTTSLGMAGKDALDLPLNNLPENAIVNDIVYVPLMTNLLREAAARGNTVVTGIGMLLHQARPAFEQWFGILPTVSASLEKKVLA